MLADHQAKVRGPSVVLGPQVGNRWVKLFDSKSLVGTWNRSIIIIIYSILCHKKKYRKAEHWSIQLVLDLYIVGVYLEFLELVKDNGGMGIANQGTNTDDTIHNVRFHCYR